MGKRFTDVKHFEPGEKILWDALKKLFGVDDESPNTVWHGLPVCGELGKKDMEPDIAIIDKKIGLLIIEVKDATIEQIDNIDGPAWWMNESWYRSGIKGREEKESPIFQARKQMFACIDEIKKESDELIDDYGRCLIAGNHLVCLPFVTEQEFTEKFESNKYLKNIIFKNSIENLDMDRILSRFDVVQKQISDQEFMKARCAVSGAKFIAKPISRPPKNDNSQWAKLRECRKNNIPFLSLQQELAGRTIPEGPQKIRGLAGTGKTIVMAMKFAHANAMNPDWKILVTYSTKTLKQSLFSSIKECINAEIIDPSLLNNDSLPNNLKIEVAHSVIYSLCNHYKLEIEGVNRYSFTQFLKANSNNLITKIESLKASNNFEPLYDFVLVDESQDLPDSFLRLCLSIAKDDRFVWGIDEMQQLADIKVRTTEEIFGLDQFGKPRVSLLGTYPDNVPKDLVLNTVYRTPRPILVASHIYGLGLLRERGCAQSLSTVSQWNDIGYEVKGATENELKVGDQVIVSRSIDRSPNRLETLVGYENILETKYFSSQEEEYDWVAKKVDEDIKIGEFPPEEILIIHLLNSKVKNFFIDPIKKRLNNLGINVFNSYEDTNKFSKKGKVTIQTQRRAKGNESGKVYVTGFGYSEGDWSNYVLTQQRNTAFMAMTRSSGFLTVTGSGEEGKIAIDELNKIYKFKENVPFEVPDSKMLRQLYSDDMIKTMDERDTDAKLLKILEETNKLKGLSKEKQKQLRNIMTTLSIDEEKDYDF